MKKKLTLRLATADDNEALYSLNFSSEVSGAINTAFVCENYFNWLKTFSNEFQVFIARLGECGMAAGMATRVIKKLYVNQIAQEIGFLCGLRIHSDFQNTTLLLRAYKFLKKLHEDKRCSFYLSLILADNLKSNSMITSQRAGLPAYLPWGKFHYYLITEQKSAIELNYTITNPILADIDRLIQFLNKEGPCKQFFPIYSRADVSNTEKSIAGLKLKNMLIAKDGGEIVGVLACLDQSKIKRTIVKEYNGVLKYMRGLYNFLGKVHKKPHLVKPGETMKILNSSLLVIRNNDSNIFQQLLSVMIKKQSINRTKVFTLALHEDDKLNTVMEKFYHKIYDFNFYIVHYPEDQVDMDTLKQRVPYLDSTKIQ